MALQMTLARGDGSRSWWVIWVVAWLLGAFVNHAMYVMSHEAARNPTFGRR